MGKILSAIVAETKGQGGWGLMCLCVRIIFNPEVLEWLEIFPVDKKKIYSTGLGEIFRVALDLLITVEQ